MYRFSSVENCPSHELFWLEISESANMAEVVRDALADFCRLVLGCIAIRPEIAADQFRVWFRVDELNSTRVGTGATSWLKQHLSVRIDSPGTTRPHRMIYISGSITAWGPCTVELYHRGYQNKTFQEYLILTYLEKWRDEAESEGLNLKPVLVNTRVWVEGNPILQWGYDAKGKIIEFENATLPEPEEHFTHYQHLIPPPPVDAEAAAREQAELDEMMKLPTEERIARWSAIAQEAKRQKHIARGEEEDS